MASSSSGYSLPASEAVQALVSSLADESPIVKEASMDALKDISSLNPLLVLECCDSVSRGGRRRFGNMAGVFQVMAFSVGSLHEKDVDPPLMAKLAKIATAEMISSKEPNADWKRASTCLLLSIGSHFPEMTMEEFSGYPIHEPQSSSLPSLSVDVESLQQQIDELSGFSDTPAPSVTRILYSEKDVLARRYVKNLMEQSGLSIREDAVGNIFGRWDGDDPELAAVATGSHIDAIPYSGKYDGVVGVLGAIEAINVLRRSGFKPKRPLEVILFTSEEPTRFGISCLGSRLLAGSAPLAKSLKKTVDGENISFFDAARSAGYAQDLDLSTVFLKKGTYSAFLELHIEQGPILENEGISIGIVTAIAAPASIKVDFEGNGGHAGAVLMPQRNDAGLAAAELAMAVEKHVLESGSIDTVGTVGILELHPGAINSIPSKSHLEIDTRDIDEKRRNSVVEKIHQSAIDIAKNRKVKLSEFTIVNQDPPAPSDKSIIKAMEDASRELNLTHKLMISRAYHDSLFMARVSPMGMIFIPCYKGYSHKPEEYASREDMANGVKVLALTLAKLSLA